jgi:hypothetical protein
VQRLQGMQRVQRMADRLDMEEQKTMEGESRDYSDPMKRT